jgi:hypothetical protein
VVVVVVKVHIQVQEDQHKQEQVVKVMQEVRRHQLDIHIVVAVEEELVKQVFQITQVTTQVMVVTD